MTLLGSWWLVILLAITGVLFLIALSRRNPDDAGKNPRSSSGGKLFNKFQTNAPVKPTAEMIKLDELIAQHYPLLVTTLRHNRIIVQRGEEQTIMLTIDKKVSAGSRKLGDATVVNFHRVPSLDELRDLLK